MFTGIVEEVGRVVSLRRGARSRVLEIGGDVIFSDLRLGDSVSVEGVCLTVSDLSSGSFCADVMNETLQHSTLGDIKQGQAVNLERALAANGRFGGHIVSGHIDGTGTIKSIKRDDNAIRYHFNASPDIVRYVVRKGSIAIDGISLTVVSVWGDGFDVSIIPHTAQLTTLSRKAAGDRVNLECDILGKYVEKLVGLGSAAQGISMDVLARNWFIN